MTGRTSPRHAAPRGRHLWWLHAGKSDGRQWRRAFVAIAALVAGSGGGIASAYVATSGAGTGQATSGTVRDAIVATATATPSLVPGGTGTVHFTIHNPNAVSVTFTTVTAATVITSTPGTCPTTRLSAPTLPYSGFPPITVEPGATSAESVAGLLELATTAPTSCQGAIFTVTLSLWGKSS